ncbi:Allantoinase [Methylobacterium crusticola]|uniref:Allantoinase n=1 Tax=Methylobacterium crusticola TaxID=1697972 RepID=A0ABQ4R602_9HYPH|nr:dihydroorotase family protein [Methylobacterium crusticola]GJD53138.1 Allantoinase [Methylobacterium crusticola]
MTLDHDSLDHDLLIRGGEAVLPGRGRTACDIAVRDGRIAAILAPGAPARARAALDARGLVVLPGAIDVHLHLGHGRDIARPREPADADRESAAAAMGGITCFIPYLMASDPFAGVLPEVIAVTQAGARIDFGYHPIISTEAQLAEVERCARELGAPTFKIFMNNRGGEGARLGLPDIDDGFLLRLCEAAARAGGMVCPHPETIELAWVTRERARAADPDGTGGLATWNASRPPFVEADAVQRAGYVAATAGVPLYVVHTSSAEALAAGLRLRQAGATLHLETCPHYLTHDVGWPGGDVGKINPPLREAADREALWAGLLSGAIDTVATDHVHRGIDAKAGGIWAASPGCPGLETLLPVLLSEGHHARGLSLERVVDLVSTTPARLMGLGHAKGAIAPGLDADLAFVDLDAVWTVAGDSVVSSAGYSLYEGWRLRGRVVHAAVRGRFVLRDGALQDDAVGHGRYVARRLPERPRAAAAGVRAP